MIVGIAPASIPRGWNRHVGEWRAILEVTGSWNNGDVVSAADGRAMAFRPHVVRRQYHRGGELPFKAEVPLNRVGILPERIAEVSRLDEGIGQRQNRRWKRVCGRD